MQWYSAIVGTVMAGRVGVGQEWLNHDLKTRMARVAREGAIGSLPHTIKAGELRLLIEASMETDWRSNVNLQQGNSISDFVMTPLVHGRVSYPVTPRNVFSLNVGVGYRKYIEHDELSTWYLASGSEVAFDVFVDNWRFELHDRVDFSQGTEQRADVAGTGDLATLRNSAGMVGSWDLGPAVVTLGLK